jgi:hypothetical protein
VAANTNTKVAWIGAAALIIAAMIGAGWFTFYRNTVEIRGRVIEAVTRRPIVHADVSLVSSSENDTTDDNGRFKLAPQDLARDTKEVRVVIAKTGYETIDRSVPVPKRDWVIELVRHVEVSDQPPPPNVRAVIPALEVTAQPIKIDFVPKPSGGPSPGCACGARDISFPNGPYTFRANEEFMFRYDNSRICRGQYFDNFQGVVSWDGARSTPMVDNKKNDEFPGIAGSLKVKYSIAGDYNVNASFSLDCLDVGCRNTCSSRGTTQVHIR